MNEIWPFLKQAPRCIKTYNLRSFIIRAVSSYSEAVNYKNPVLGGQGVLRTQLRLTDY